MNDTHSSNFVFISGYSKTSWFQVILKHFSQKKLRSFFWEKCLRLSFFALAQIFKNSTSACLHQSACKIYMTKITLGNSHLSPLHFSVSYNKIRRIEYISNPYIWKWVQIYTSLSTVTSYCKLKQILLKIIFVWAD